MKKRFKNIVLFFFFFYCSFFCFADELIIEPDQGREPILSAITQAKSSIDLALYGLTDINFMQALTHAKNTNKNVRVLLEPSPYKAANENTQAIQFLRKAHVPLHWPSAHFYLLHQKTFLFDHSTALIMTLNLTHSSFSHERNFALFMTDPAMVQEIQQVFNADWNQQSVKVENPHLVWSPNNSRKKILAFIQEAQTGITIYMENITDYQIIGALAKAARAHIQVNILVSTLPAKKPLHYLTQAGVIVHRSHDYFIHAKVILVDHKQAIVGSINLTPVSLDKNRELSVITQDKKVIQALEDTFKRDFIAAG